MTGKEIIKKLMEEKDVTNAQLAKRLGVTQATMWARLNYKNVKDVSLGVFFETIEALGYEIVIREKRETGEPREMSVKIDEPAVEERRGRPKKEDSGLA